MELQGITDGKLMRKLNEGLDATKIQTSPTEPDREVTDYPTRLKYIQEANRLRDNYPAKQINVDKRQANVNIYADMSEQQLAKAKARLLEEIQRAQS